MQRTWEGREALILEAVAQAQEEGTEANIAARAAVPDLDANVYKETLASLEDDGYLSVAIQRNGVGRVEGAHVRRITPKGRRVVGQWPTDDPASELLAVLQQQIEQETDPVERSRLERLRDALGDVSKSVVAGLVTAAAKSLTGLE